jgi:hypothetical protein
MKVNRGQLNQMTKKLPIRINSDCQAKGAAVAGPRGTRAKWLLIAAIVLQVAWIAALAVMAVMSMIVRSRT